MKKMGISGIALLMSVCMPLAAGAADFESSRTILCSVISVYEHTLEDGARAITPESVALPQFLMVDIANKKVWPAMDREGKRKSDIKRVERMAGQLILQGADAGIDEKREAVSWTATVSEETGKFIMTAAGDEAAFVVFGACLPQ